MMSLWQVYTNTRWQHVTACWDLISTRSTAVEFLTSAQQGSCTLPAPCLGYMLYLHPSSSQFRLFLASASTWVHTSLAKIFCNFYKKFFPLCKNITKIKFDKELRIKSHLGGGAIYFFVSFWGSLRSGKGNWFWHSFPTFCLVFNFCSDKSPFCGATVCSLFWTSVDFAHGF